MVAAVAASTCCAGPLLLLTLGISGAWIGHLTALERYRPLFIIVAILFLGLAFWRLYFVRQACPDADCCTDQRAEKRQKVVFWIVAFVAFVAFILLAFPWYAPMLF